LRPPRTASVTTAGYATALYWPWLNQIYEAYRVGCGKAAAAGTKRYAGCV